MARGRAMASDFGTSSPTTIVATVASTSAMTMAVPDARSSLTTRPTSGSIASAIVGSAMKPISSDVTVIPSCAPDRLNDRRRRAVEVARARRLPACASSSTRSRSTATNANSTATKNPVARISRSTANRPIAVSMSGSLWEPSGWRLAAPSNLRPPVGCPAMGLGRDVLLEVLRTEGVRHVFGNPGSTELPLIDALADADDLRYVLALQEATVVGMADGYAQATGRPAFVNLHTSAGLGNAIGNLTNARSNRTPLVVTAGQQDYRHIVTDPLLSGPLVELASGTVKWGHEVRTPAELGTVLRRAFHDADHPPAGPVFVSLPMDQLDQDAGPAPAAVDGARVDTVAGGLEELADLLTTPSVGRVALVVGDAVAAAGAVSSAVALAEALGAPVHGAPLHGRGVFPPAHPLWKGMLAPTATACRRRSAAYQRVLLVADAAFTVYPYTPGPAVPPEVELLHLSPDAGQLGRAWPVRLGVVGHPRATLDALRPARAGASRFGGGRRRPGRGSRGPGGGDRWPRGHGPRTLRSRADGSDGRRARAGARACRRTRASSTRPSPPVSTSAASTTGPNRAATSSARVGGSAGGCRRRAASRSRTVVRPCCAWSATAPRCTRRRRCGPRLPRGCRWCSRWSTTASTRSSRATCRAWEAPPRARVASSGWISTIPRSTSSPWPGRWRVDATAVEHAGDVGDAVKAALDAGRPHLLELRIRA